MKIVFHERFYEVYAGDPAAAPGRMEAIVRELREAFNFIEPGPATELDIERVHGRSHVQSVRQEGPAYEVGLLAAGGAILASETAWKGEPAFGLIRPPGHHASPHSCWGFCYFNNIAIAVQKLLHEEKIRKALSSNGFIAKRLSEYRETFLNPQKGFVIFQEFIPHEYEWRCVRIGDSFFAHKKIARNNKSSGTLIKAYDKVPEALLDFIREMTERTGLSSVAIDLFERDGMFLVNEIQCFFGQSDPYQMLVDSVPGRYRLADGKWIFEPGDFASNECYDLRLEHALTLLRSGK